MRGRREMGDGGRGGDGCTELYCTTPGAGGGDRLWFWSGAGRKPVDLGEAQLEGLFEPSQ